MDKPAPTISDLFPEYTEDELAEAEEALDRYLMLVLKSFERLESEGKLGEKEQLREE
jgi:hypothetical protein